MSDGGGMYLEVMPNGSKYWRLKYRVNVGDKRVERRLALGVYPEVSIKEARNAAAKARAQVREGIDPLDAKKQTKLSQHIAASNSFEAVALEWLEKNKIHWVDSYTVNVSRYINNYLVPYIGKRPIKEITAPELLAVLRKKESQGYYETAHRMKQVCGKIFRYAVSTGRAERDPSRDLDGALAKPKEKHLAALTEPDDVKKLLIAIDNFHGTKTVETALKLAPLVFVRPGELRHMEWSEVDLKNKLW